MTYRGTNTYLLGRHDLAVIDPGPLSDAHLGCHSWPPYSPTSVSAISSSPTAILIIPRLQHRWLNERGAPGPGLWRA